jgi:agmatinase
MEQFLGISDNRLNASNARVVIIPVPFENSVSYGEGTADGPEAIIEASSQVELYDTLCECQLPETAVYTHDEIGRTVHYEGMAGEVLSLVGKILNADQFPLVLGGEHSIAVPAVQSFARKFPGGTVVHFDAHADLREQYQDNPNSHACALRRIRETNVRTISAGIRSMSQPEREFASREKILLISPETPSFWPELESALADVSGPAWLTFDVDGMDPSVMPATGTPEPGGLTWTETMRFFSLLATSNLVFKGADVVEFSPIRDFHYPQFTVAKLIHRLMLFLSFGCQVVK